MDIPHLEVGEDARPGGNGQQLNLHTESNILATPSTLLTWNRGMMRAPVAMASSSISTPPTHRTAGRSLCIKRWLASSSNPGDRQRGGAMMYSGGRRPNPLAYWQLNHTTTS